jgi:hypothetical protein
MAEAHSLFSASGASGWMRCHGKIAMEAGRRTSSEYADEGTAAHTLASWVMERRIKGERATAQMFIGKVIDVKGSALGPVRKFTVDKEMAEYVDDFVDGFFAATQGVKALRFTEQRVHYHETLGVRMGEAFGTSDGVGVLFDQPELEWNGQVMPAGDELVIDDLKYGMGVMVDAEDNEQLMLYALGCLYEYHLLGDFVRVRMIIDQPRKQHYSEVYITVEALLAWGETAKAEVPRVQAAMALAGTVPHKKVAETLMLAGYLKAGEKQCKFCDGKGNGPRGVCPALDAEVRNAVSGGKSSPDDFEMVIDSPAEVRTYGDNFMPYAASQLAQVELWAKGVRAEIDRRVLLEGRHVDGFKVVAGKRGDRKFEDPGRAEAILRAARVPDEAIYSTKLKTPTQLEKALKAQPIWLQVAPLITQADGKPAVVPTSDPRPAIAHKAVVDDFEDETDAEGAAAVISTPHPFR